MRPRSLPADPKPRPPSRFAVDPARDRHGPIPPDDRKPRRRSAGASSSDAVAASSDASPVVTTALPVRTQELRQSNLERSVIRAACIGAVASMTAVTAAVALNGGGVGSIGAGIMVAGFDGIPFGAMIGAMLHFLRHPEEQ